MDVRFLEGDAGGEKRFLGLAGHGERQVEDADDGRALRAAEMGVAAANHVGGDPPLPIGRAGQRHQRRPAGDEVADFDRVAHRENVRVAGAHLVVNMDAAGGADLQARLAGEFRVGPHAHPQDHQVGGESLVVLGHHRDRLLRPRLEGAHRVAQAKINPLPPQLLVQRLDHLRIGRRHHLIGQLQQRDGDAAAAEVFGHFQADVAAADHHRASDAAVVDPGVDAINVVHVSHGEDSGQVDAGQRRPQRLGPGGEHQGVVPLDRDGPGGDVVYLDRLVLAVDVADFVPRADLDIEEVAESLGRGHQQASAVADGAADVVGQAAVGEGDVAAPLEDVDFRPFVHASQPRRARRPAGHAADDQHTFASHDRMIFNTN